MTQPQHIVSSEWLHENLDDPHLIILDASQGNNKPDPKADQEDVRIKGARFFDIKNRFSDKTTDLPNTLPTSRDFEKECQMLGINTTSKIVVYDRLGIYTSPRVWWMFKAMGHEHVWVLDGGLPDWTRKGFETERLADERFERGDFEANHQPYLIKGMDDVVSNLTSEVFTVIDARSEGRFNGTAPEPREGLPSGHIPKSINIPFNQVLVDGKFRSSGELRAIFDPFEKSNNPLVFSCGSGITACIVMLASELVLKNEKSVYDGSWTEWASVGNLPIEP